MAVSRGTNATFDTRLDGDTALITVTGEFDLAEIEPFRREFRGALEGSTSVGLDMAGVRFIDSSGLRAMLQCRADAEEAGKKLRLVDSSAVVARLLDLTSLTDAFA